MGLNFGENRREIVRQDEERVVDGGKLVIRKPDVDNCTPHGDDAAVTDGVLSCWRRCC